MGLTVSHQLSATAPSDPAFEIQNKHWNSSHLFTLNAAGSEVSGAFANGGGITFGLSADGFITAAAPAGAPSPINFSAGTTSSNIGSVVFSDASGVSWGLNGSTITASVRTNYQSAGAYLTTAALSGDTTKYAGVGETVGTIAGTDIAITMNTDGLSLAYPKYITTAALSGDTTKYAGVGETVGTTAGTDLALTVNTDGVSIGYPKWITTADLSANSSNYAGVGETVGTIAGTDLAMTVNTAGVSIGYPKWITTAALSGDTTKYAGVGETVGTIAGTDIAITMNTDGLSLGYPKAITTARASTDAIGLNTAQTNVTWTVNSSGLSLNAGGYAGTSTTFNGANISGSMTHNTLGLALSLSVAAPGAAAESNAFNLLGANTAGNTTATGSTIGLSGLNLTLSGVNNSQIVVSAPATSSLVGTSGLSISTAGSTISIYPTPLYSYEVYPIQDASAVLSANNGTSGMASFFPFVVNEPLAAGMLLMAMNMSFTTIGTSSGRQSQTFSYGLYTQGTGANSSTMGTITSASFSLGVTGNNSSYTFNQPTSSNSAGYTTQTTNSSGVNISSGYTGGKLVQFPVGKTLQPGNYWLGLFVANSTSSVNVGLSESFIGAGVSSTAVNMAPIGSFSSAYSTGTNVMLRLGNIRLGHGSFSSAGQTNLPASVAFSAISHNLTVMPYMYFWSTV